MAGINPSGYYVIGEKDGVKKIFSGPHSDRWSASSAKTSQWYKDYTWSYDIKSGTELIKDGVGGFNEFGVIQTAPKTGLEKVADTYLNYQQMRLQQERELEQQRIAEQKAAEERARRERINLFNRTHKNTSTGYDYDSNDKKLLAAHKSLTRSDLQAYGSRGTRTTLGALGGLATGAALGEGLRGLAKLPKSNFGPAAGLGTLGAIAGGILGYKSGKKVDDATTDKKVALNKKFISEYSKRVAESKLDKIDPSVYYVLEYNDDAWNKGVHKVLRGFDDKTHALAYRNDLRQKGKEVFINKGSTLLAKGADITGI